MKYGIRRHRSLRSTGRNVPRASTWPASLLTTPLFGA
jgi:hypothetical protein